MESEVGYLTAGAGTPHERKVKIVDGIVFDWADHRVVSVMQLEGKEGYTLALENPPHTGRSNNTWWLSEESFIALVTSINIFCCSKGLTTEEAIKDAIGGDKMRYYKYGDIVTPFDNK